jgi:hypothetical protein
MDCVEERLVRDPGVDHPVTDRFQRSIWQIGVVNVSDEDETGYGRVRAELLDEDRGVQSGQPEIDDQDLGLRLSGSTDQLRLVAAIDRKPVVLEPFGQPAGQGDVFGDQTDTLGRGRQSPGKALYRHGLPRVGNICARAFLG